MTLAEKSAGLPKPYDWSHFIIQKAPAGIITMDSQGRITTCNPAAEEITGYSAKQIIGNLIQDSLRCQRCEDEDNPIRLAIQGQDIENQETLLLNSSGQEVPVMLRAFALKDDLGVRCGGVIIFQDLTPVKHLEKERRHLVNMFAHDLKTPVVGMAGLIRRMLQGKSGPLSEEQLSYLETVDHGMRKLEDLIAPIPAGFGEFVGKCHQICPATNLCAAAGPEKRSGGAVCHQRPWARYSSRRPAAYLRDLLPGEGCRKRAGVRPGTGHSQADHRRPWRPHLGRNGP
jgi:PAS domain S-box-containing protein